MRDEETGSWWQQVTGEAIQGPLKGQTLRSVYHDEVTFGLWKREKPEGRVLRPNEQTAQSGNYLPANWEESVARMPVATSAALDKSLEPRTLILGVTINGVAKAYPFAAMVKQSLILDEVGGVPIFIVRGDDNRSVRAFESSADGRKLEFFLKPNTSALTMVDAETGSEWDFTGRAIAGTLSGRQLKKISILNDYWFDWTTYNPKTQVYKLGNR